MAQILASQIVPRNWDWDKWDDSDVYDSDRDNMDPEELKNYAPSSYFKKYEAVKLREKKLDLDNKFDELLSQRRNAFVYHQYDIMDIDINSYLRIKIKMTDLMNGDTTNKIIKRTDTDDIDTEGISILNSDQIEELFREYENRIADIDISDNETDSRSNISNSSFLCEREEKWPHLSFDILKCKWID
eukprot:330432_1